MNLTNDDVQDILHLLDDLQYDELHLTTRSFTLSLRRSAVGEWTQQSRVLSAPAPVQQPPPGEDGPAAAAPRADASATASRSDPPDAASPPRREPAAARQHHVRAPLPGTFYRSPKPGAPPFVEVGSHVDEHTVVGIIEVMKLMNSVHAGVRGTVADICLEDAAFAEKDEALILVDPEAP